MQHGRADLASFLAALLAAVWTSGSFGASWIINGLEVPAGSRPEIVKLTSSDCTATIVGPRTLLTAGHCADTGETSTFVVGGTTYQAKMTRSPLYAEKNHDLALGVTSQDIVGIKPATIGGKASTGLGLTLYGYGCTQAGGGPKDGKLRQGDTVVTSFANFDMVSKKPQGGAICFGDSGGPAYVKAFDQSLLLLGVHSTGNVVDTNYDTRTDIDESQTFFRNFAQSQGVSICGINSDCGTGPVPPPKPTCTLTASPSSVKVGQTLQLQLVAQNADSADIERSPVTVPTASVSVTPSAAGTFLAHATVNGKGGTGTCQASYVVTIDPQPPTAPTCTLSATPDDIGLGDSLTLEISVQGQATSATIDGTAVAIADGKKVITPASKGDFTATGNVTGPGGVGTCSAAYKVEDKVNPLPPGVPNFAVAPAYCGENSVTETKVATVCLAVVKHDLSITDLRVPQVLLITYADSTKEVLPILSRAVQKKDPNDVQTKTKLTVYANGSVTSKNYQVLDTREATLTEMPAVRGVRGSIPTAIEGRTARGAYFLVPSLSVKTNR